jgi:hypothetical protein
MAQFHPAWVERERRRFMRPNAHLYIRHDAYRYMAPGAPRYVGKDVVRYFWPDLKTEQAVQRNDRHEDEERERVLAVAQQSLDEVRHALADVKFWLRFRQLLRKAGFNPDQPRVPAGNSGGGQWTGENESGSESSASTQLAGGVIRICVVGARALTTDKYGNKSFMVEYVCAGGGSFIRRGSGHSFPGIVIDPLQ